MGFLAPKAPTYTPPPAPPPAAAPATLASPELSATSNQRARAAAAASQDGTLQTTAQGLKTQPNTAKASLLGDATK